MKSTSSHRWFRFAFSLRTLFVVVTIFGIWLGWQLKIVRERKAIIAEFKRECYGHDEHFYSVDTASPLDREIDYARVDYVRRLLGDKGMLVIWIPKSLGARFVDSAQDAFPEAELRIYGTERRNVYEYRESARKPRGTRNFN